MMFGDATKVDATATGHATATRIAADTTTESSVARASNFVRPTVLCTPNCLACGLQLVGRYSIQPHTQHLARELLQTICSVVPHLCGLRHDA